MESNQIQELKRETVDVIQKKISELVDSKQLRLPHNYSAENALRAAWLIIQDLEDKNGRPVLEVCTKASVCNAMLDMVVQALNPMKKQCYFIAYGNTLTCTRSYFGNIHLVKMLAGAVDVWAQVVYADDEFEYEIEKDKKVVTKHKQKIGNVSNQKIVAAYATVEFTEGKQYTDIMTAEQIHKSWEKSKQYKRKKEKGEITVQDDFTEEMCKRTVINRACKKFINSSNDSCLMFETLNRVQKLEAEASVEEEIDEKANGEAIDIVAEVVNDETPQEEPVAAEPVEPEVVETEPETPQEPPEPVTIEVEVVEPEVAEPPTAELVKEETPPPAEPEPVKAFDPGF